MVLLVGTSPVVRGLRDALWRRWCSWWVHPRSCGVCEMPLATMVLLVGTPPVVRGLRDAVGYDGALGGYIPARAGSAFRGTPPKERCQVHPRLCGVCQYYIFLKQQLLCVPATGGPFFSVHAGQACGRLHPPHCSQRIFGFHRAASWVSRTLSQKERGLYPKMKRPCQWRMGMTE